MKKLLALLCAVCTTCVFTACGDDSSSVSSELSGSSAGVFPKVLDVDKTEDGYIVYPYMPNIQAEIDFNLDEVLLVSVTSGKFHISFSADEKMEAPTLVFYDTSLVKLDMEPVEAKQVDNRWTYDFDGPSLPAFWLVRMFIKDGTPFKNTLKNMRYEGESGKNVSKISLNFVTIGKYPETGDNVPLETLGNKIAEEIHKTYQLEIDTVYFSKASEHPVVGKNYPDDEPYVGDMDEDNPLAIFFPDMVASWGSAKKDAALDIFLVEAMSGSDFVAISPNFGLSMGENGLGVSITFRDLSDIEDLDLFESEDIEEYNYTSEEIIHSVVHEVGHYFGLPHTTLTSDDTNGDYAVVDDGIEDTEVCKELVDAEREGELMLYSICPDYNNIMFPYMGMDNLKSTVSKGQLEIIQKTLPLLVP